MFTTSLFHLPFDASETLMHALPTTCCVSAAYARTCSIERSEEEKEINTSERRLKRVGTRPAVCTWSYVTLACAHHWPPAGLPSARGGSDSSYPAPTEAALRGSKPADAPARLHRWLSDVR